MKDIIAVQAVILSHSVEVSELSKVIMDEDSLPIKPRFLIWDNDPSSFAWVTFEVVIIKPHSSPLSSADIPILI